MSDNKERDKLRKKEEKELRESESTLINSDIFGFDKNKKYVKRYVPINAVGSFFCTGCIIDSAKNIIGLQNPEILEINSHQDGADFLNTAFGCLMKIIQAKKPTLKLLIINPLSLQTNNIDGVLFLGVDASEMNDEESKKEFFDRVKQEFMSLGLMKDKLDEDMTEEDKQHYQEYFDVDYLNDVCINYTEQVDEDDIDDHDIGYEEGFGDGFDVRYYKIQVALYKMFKNKRLKNFYQFMDDLHNTMVGMDLKQFNRYEKAFQKYLKKEQKKEIEGDE